MNSPAAMFQNLAPYSVAYNDLYCMTECLTACHRYEYELIIAHTYLYQDVYLTLLQYGCPRTSKKVNIRKSLAFWACTSSARH